MMVFLFVVMLANAYTEVAVRRSDGRATQDAKAEASIQCGLSYLLGPSLRRDDGLKWIAADVDDGFSFCRHAGGCQYPVAFLSLLGPGLRRDDGLKWIAACATITGFFFVVFF
jgi:hypothetical protein